MDEIDANMVFADGTIRVAKLAQPVSDSVDSSGR